MRDRLIAPVMRGGEPNALARVPAAGGGVAGVLAVRGAAGAGQVGLGRVGRVEWKDMLSPVGPLRQLLAMGRDRLMAFALRSVLMRGRVCPRLERRHRRDLLYSGLMFHGKRRVAGA
ncbi:hypothetical protein [Actinomadura geliboluensis]|uniref:hypothetical protein n=1 Tax=Actinomadura geliboluensis TaxID=882440 RepID=UPI0036C6BE35